jgi:hypothetical protein
LDGEEGEITHYGGVSDHATTGFDLAIFARRSVRCSWVEDGVFA